MDGRGSFREFHRELSASHSFGLAAQQRVYDWGAMKRPPPPLPSLPPWAASSQASQQPLPPHLLPQLDREDERDADSDSTSGWRKPSSYFGSMKRLPLGLKESSASVPNSSSHEPSTVDHHTMNQQSDVDEGAPHSIPSSAACNSDAMPSDSLQSRQEEEERTNQSEDDGAAFESDIPAVTTPMATPGFFRPWKKAQLQDAAEDNNREDETVNKWKVRALMNPFAKRKQNASRNAATGALARMRLAPSEPEQNAREEFDPAPRMPSKARPTSPLPAPTTITPHAPPTALQPVSHRNLRSRGATPPEVLGFSSVESLPLSEFDRSGAVFPSQTRRVASLVQRSPAVRTGSRVLEPLQTGSSAAEPIDHQPREPQQSKDQEPMDASDVFDRESHPSYAAPLRPKPQLTKYAPATKARPKLSTLDALNEIKRKREARRTQHSEEKERIKAELKEHGDDVGYKFRRLITKYREGLPPEQHPVKQGALPPLRAITNEYHRGVDAPKLSVFVRKRPLSKKELKAKGYDIISCLFANENVGSAAERDRTVRTVRRELLCHEPKLKVDGSESLENHSFHFDGVFDEWQDNSSIYDATVGPLVPFLVDQQASGLEAPTVTVFAYGQTGSGKTFTMKSIYRQAATDLFDQLASSPVDVGVSFYEIYMNQVNDLLNGRKRVQLMEDGDGVVQLLGLQQIGITTAEELLDLVKRGEDSRATSANAVHNDSSRSHALLRVTLYAQDSKRVVARLAMVDLAGSERASDTQADSKSTRMEGAEINKSLLALKECIRALNRGASHIPFRQSKLTQLLRDSFICEQSKTIMIATVSPWSESCNHTLNTLRYADRLKEIGS